MRRNTHGTERCGRGALRVTALLTLVIALLAAPATAGAAAAGALKQLPAEAGCIVDETSAVSGCEDVRGMRDIGRIAISADGKNVYVPSRGRNALVVFDRNVDSGALKQKTGALGCYTSDSTIATQDNCTLVASGLSAVSAAAVSPDGANVYTVSRSPSNSLSNFTRTSAGDLALVGSNAHAGPMAGVAVSPDSQSVYASVLGGGGFISAWRRGATPGAALSFRGCFMSAGAPYGCTGVANGYVDEPADLAVTPDGGQLLVANGENTGTSFSTGTLTGWTRTTAAGATLGDLTAPTSATCISGNPLAACQQRSGQHWPRGLAVTNNKITLAGYYGMFVVDRNAGTNALTPNTGPSHCTSFDGHSWSGCSSLAASTRVVPSRDVVVSPDGSNVYLGTEASIPTVFSFSRGADGSFAELPAPLFCLNADASDSCGTLRGGSRIESMVGDDQNRNVYAAGANRLFSFAIDRPPTCQNVSAGTAHNTSVAVKLNCSDPDGDNVVYEKVGDPARGTLGGVQGDTINYNPLTGTSGADSFTYRAVAAGATSDPATVTVNVAGAPPPPPPPPPPPVAVTLIPSTVTNKWSAFPNFTTVRGLSVKTLPAGTKVVTTCKTKKKRLQKKRCPYKSKTVTTPTARAKLNLAKPFRKRKLPIGTRVRITITAPNFIGKVFTYTVRRRALPAFKLQCLAPGATKPGKCS